MPRLWDKGLPLDERILRFTAGEDHKLDERLVPYDVRASVAHARRALAEQFRAARIDSPELDARILIGHALGLDHAGLASAASQQISDLTATQIERFAEQTLHLAVEPGEKIHSTSVVVVDRQGQIRGSFSALDQSATTRLQSTIATLLAE